MQKYSMLSIKGIIWWLIPLLRILNRLARPMHISGMRAETKLVVLSRCECMVQTSTSKVDLRRRSTHQRVRAPLQSPRCRTRQTSSAPRRVPWMTAWCIACPILPLWRAPLGACVETASHHRLRCGRGHRTTREEGDGWFDQRGPTTHLCRPAFPR